jgi:hypothetical protein
MESSLSQQRNLSEGEFKSLASNASSANFSLERALVLYTQSWFDYLRDALIAFARP